MNSLSPLAQHYVEGFEQALENLPGADDRSISTLRKAGIDKFSVLDFPTKRIEEWRFTNLARLTKGGPEEDQPSTPSLQQDSFDAAYEMVFVNGHFSLEKSNLDSLPEGVHLAPLSQALGNGAVFFLDEAENRSLMALNTAYMQDGACLYVDENVSVPGILKIRYETDGDEGENIHLRNRISMSSGAELTILEEFEGHGTYFMNPVTLLSLEEGAKLNHYRFQNESQSAFHVSLTDGEIAKGAEYKNFTLSVGARLSRNELKTSILGEEALSKLDGAYLIDGHQHCDTTTLTEHKHAGNVSEQVYKGVLAGKSHGVFQGKIHIFPDAQQVNGDQLSKALLLSDDAQIDCKPELEIYADDVKCSHGATSGELDDDALFYMQARGIPTDEARKMLVGAFLGDVLEEIGNDTIKEYFTKLSTAWLERV
ncbi:Fe-S cluster assembly protein SufD [Sneathiella sp. P13V-1]|uniref:Fe-S cluster assembly protein SufD n=1 Tax=Sneathiella sp. P13V-1 TaxID=2697366 RepID=UPI00187B3B44|nr:Fe-S cluster assembly protein SufD [Sneathiella sp. P13V-1]MBE7637700.1 Fe-S cluster assembly protein SufD [Sneathiella sp. P13V-1]